LVFSSFNCLFLLSCSGRGGPRGWVRMQTFFFAPVKTFPSPSLTFSFFFASDDGKGMSPLESSALSLHGRRDQNFFLFLLSTGSLSPWLSHSRRILFLSMAAGKKGFSSEGRTSRFIPCSYVFFSSLPFCALTTKVVLFFFFFLRSGMTFFSSSEPPSPPFGPGGRSPPYFPIKGNFPFSTSAQVTPLPPFPFL